MVKIDSDEYWQIKTWDRFKEIELVRPKIRDEFMLQEENTVESILSLAHERGFLHILDLACGTGKISDSILRALLGKVHITLVDFNPRTLDKAKTYLSYHNNLDFRCVNAYHIGRRFTGQFDVVICLDFLHHASNLKSILSGIYDVLTPYGVLVGNVLAAETYAEWDRMKYGILKSSRRRLLNIISRAIYDVSPSLVKKLIRLFGFARIEPLTREELSLNMGTFFEDLKIVSTYYHWFSATRKT